MKITKKLATLSLSSPQVTQIYTDYLDWKDGGLPGFPGLTFGTGKFSHLPVMSTHG
jgi:hypothetical protein